MAVSCKSLTSLKPNHPLMPLLIIKRRSTMFRYSEGKQEPPAFFTPYSKQNATQAYLRHYDNLLYLQFILYNPKSKPKDRKQANSELLICDRKLNWWLKHRNINMVAVAEGKTKLNKMWGKKA